ncbi:MAG: 23S rRNA (guanosine(2251)-2'-O)-methyltransferase RlmB, partial [Pseudomonadota bacterium]
PRNFGAIVRTANTVGVHGIIVPKHRSAPANQLVAKAAAGALAYTSVCRVQNLVSVIEQLKKEGIWVVGTAEDAGQSLYAFDFNLDLALVIGSEGKGMHSLVRHHCDFLISIPSRGEIPSLNASVAAAVVLYEAIRQRHYNKSFTSK